MAYDFPSSPTDNQVVGDYTYKVADQAWRKTEPAYGGLPCGAIIPWAGAVAPSNWLLCDGAAVSRTTYATLFSLIGTTYGSGNGSTTFNVPDLRGRIPVGKNGGSFGTLGATGGVESVALTEAEMPSHTHIQNAHNHSHRQWIFNGASASGYHYGFGYSTGGAANDSGAASSSGEIWYGNFPTTATNQNTGGGQAHTNLQPYQVVNYIIKTTAAATQGDSEYSARIISAETTVNGYNARVAALESELNKVSFAQINKTTLQAFGSGFMTIQFNEILFAKNIQLVGNLVRFTYPGVYKISVGMRIANDAGDSWTGMSLYNATAGRVGISYGTGNVAGDPGPMEFTFLANVTNTSVDYAVQLYRAGSVLTQLTPDTNAGKAIAATFERIGSL